MHIITCSWCRGQGSNLRRGALHTPALPTELPRRGGRCRSRTCYQRGCFGVTARPITVLATARESAISKSARECSGVTCRSRTDDSGVTIRRLDHLANATPQHSRAARMSFALSKGAIHDGGIIAYERDLWRGRILRTEAASAACASTTPSARRSASSNRELARSSFRKSAISCDGTFARDSNSHAFRRSLLRRVCLPVPPARRMLVGEAGLEPATFEF